jgi:hypothetical protein
MLELKAMLRLDYCEEGLHPLYSMLLMHGQAGLNEWAKATFAILIALSSG